MRVLPPRRPDLPAIHWGRWLVFVVVLTLLVDLAATVLEPQACAAQGGLWLQLGAHAACLRG